LLHEAAESLSVMRARQAIERADVVVLVLDGSEPIAAQDTHIAGFAKEASRPIVVAINKWDLVEEREGKAKDWEATVRERLRFVKEVPFVLVSAKSGQRVAKILERVDEQFADSSKRVPTPRSIPGCKRNRSRSAARPRRAGACASFTRRRPASGPRASSFFATRPAACTSR
jgi:GTP-binding protein